MILNKKQISKVALGVAHVATGILILKGTTIYKGD